nr:late competence development ComFB family protein [Sedimentibacter sp.]
MVINYVELCVRRFLDNVLKTDPNYSHICKCEQCIDDILAKSLNNIKPFYITSKTGEVYAEYSSLEIQNNTEVIKEVISAIEYVSKNKRHD